MHGLPPMLGTVLWWTAKKVVARMVHLRMRVCVANRAAYGRMRASHMGVYAAHRSAWHMCVCAHPAGVTLQQPEAR